MKKNLLNILGLGKTPFSASIASLLAMLTFYFIEKYFFYSSQVHFLLVSIVLLGSIIEASKNSEYALSDSKEIIIDEFIGMYLCCLIANSENFLTNFFLLISFRVLDILKPFPFSLVEKKLKGKFGFLWDDIIIGAVIGIIYRIVTVLFF